MVGIYPHWRSVEYVLEIMIDHCLVALPQIFQWDEGEFQQNGWSSDQKSRSAVVLTTANATSGTKPARLHVYGSNLPRAINAMVASMHTMLRGNAARSYSEHRCIAQWWGRNYSTDQHARSSLPLVFFTRKWVYLESKMTLPIWIGWQALRFPSIHLCPLLINPASHAHTPALFRQLL